jgi:hypothetical protein
MAGMSALLIDGGRAFANQRQAQSAADTAALAAGYAASSGQNAVAAGRTVAAANDFPTDLTNCAGTTFPGQGVVVNQPPANGPHAGQGGYVEVVTTRAVRTGFANVLGMSCWMVSARAVASIATSSVSGCSLCVLGSEWSPSLSIHGSEKGTEATLRIDGDVRVNKAAWYSGTTAVNRCAGSNPCTAPSCVAEGDPWVRPGGNSGNEDMCGRSMELHNSNGGNILWYAQSIGVSGGWQAKLPHRIHADQLADGCVHHPTPYDWTASAPVVADANVCIGLPPLVDPLNDPADPGNIVNPPDVNQLAVPVAGQNGCPAGARVPTGTLASPQRLTITSDSTNMAFPGFPFFTICPGIYYGGFSAVGDWTSVKVTMLPGIYYMVGGGSSGGGGFVVSGSASVDGSAGVMIYLTGGDESFTQNTTPGSDLVPGCTDPAPACQTPTTSGTGLGLTSSDSTVPVNTNVTYRYTLRGNPTTQIPTGNVAFYDGQNLISGCESVPLAFFSGTSYRASCTTSYPLFGSRGITGVYLGDATYKAVGLTLTQTITTSTGSAAGTFNVNTNQNDPCSLPSPHECGQVVLHAPETGPYAGLLIFQGRASGLGLTIWPAAGAPTCTGNWLTDGTPGNANPVPDPCGPLGGLKGTIYAPHVKTGGPSDHDAGIHFRTWGLADLQIITGTVSMTFDGNMRLTYQPGEYANGDTHLVE